MHIQRDPWWQLCHSPWWGLRENPRPMVVTKRVLPFPLQPSQGDKTIDEERANNSNIANENTFNEILLSGWRWLVNKSCMWTFNTLGGVAAYDWHGEINAELFRGWPCALHLAHAAQWPMLIPAETCVARICLEMQPLFDVKTSNATHTGANTAFALLWISSWQLSMPGNHCRVTILCWLTLLAWINMISGALAATRCVHTTGTKLSLPICLSLLHWVSEREGRKLVQVVSRKLQMWLWW